MPVDVIARTTLARSLRADGGVSTSSAWDWSAIKPAALVLAIVAGFTVIGAGEADLNDVEARLALAAGEGLSPFAQVMSSYDPSIPPGQVLIAQLWAWIEGGPPTKGVVRWPSALATAALGLLLYDRVRRTLGPRAGMFAALAMLATPAMMDRSTTAGYDVLAGLAVVAAIDRALARGSGWIAGLWAGAAVLLGGWVALAAVAVALVAIGRPGSTPTVKLLLPPVVALAAWSAWAWASVRADVWAAAVTMPLMRPMSWTLGWKVIRDGLPWTPVVALLAMPSIRAGLDPEGKRLVTCWLKVAAAGWLAGTLLPGLDAILSVATLAGLAVAMSAVLDRLWVGCGTGWARGAAVAVGLIVGLRWAALTLYAGAYQAVAQPYYRGVAIVLVCLAVGAILLALDGLWTRSTRGVVRTLLVAAIGTKVMLSWIVAPELNYRFSKGPWGRAVGQHVPPGATIYVVTPISPALAVAAGHPIRRLRDPLFLKAQPGDGPKFVLLAGEEFDFWPEHAPKLSIVRRFKDEYGGERVLARSAGKLARRALD